MDDDDEGEAKYFGLVAPGKLLFSLFLLLLLFPNFEGGFVQNAGRLEEVGGVLVLANAEVLGTL